MEVYNLALLNDKPRRQQCSLTSLSPPLQVDREDFAAREPALSPSASFAQTECRRKRRTSITYSALIQPLRVYYNSSTPYNSHLDPRYPRHPSDSPDISESDVSSSVQRRTHTHHAFCSSSCFHRPVGHQQEVATRQVTRDPGLALRLVLPNGRKSSRASTDIHQRPVFALLLQVSLLHQGSMASGMREWAGETTKLGC